MYRFVQGLFDVFVTISNYFCRENHSEYPESCLVDEIIVFLSTPTHQLSSCCRSELYFLRRLLHSPFDRLRIGYQERRLVNDDSHVDDLEDS